jgi:hypothetical protein
LKIYSGKAVPAPILARVLNSLLRSYEGNFGLNGNNLRHPESAICQIDFSASQLPKTKRLYGLMERQWQAPTN